MVCMSDHALPGPQHPELDSLIAVVARLRAPGGCPWDAEQTHQSLVKHLIEETYELTDAIENGTREDLLEELGDVLYQVIFHADIARADDSAPFTIEDVAAHVKRKMISRHPHVFDVVATKSTADVVAGWDDLKAMEKPHRSSVLDGIPQGMPSLALADKILGRAEKSGLLEKAAEIGGLNIADEQQLGALLLAIVSTARARGLDAERALRVSLRDLQDEIRDIEQGTAGDPFDAGLIGFGD